MRLAVLFFLFVGSAMAKEPDFWIDFTQCKNLVTYLLLSNESLGLLEGDPTLLRCIQNGTQMSCQISFPEGGHSVEQHYEIVIDLPPLLHFQTSNGSEYIAIDTAQHVAALINRYVDRQLLSAKVCQGTYATDFEMKNVE
jgi:hypothetical protein